MADDQRNGEIWSTRIQQELLALTTDNADLESTSEARSMLPPFVTIQDHILDIAEGTCVVLVKVEVPPAKSSVGDGGQEGGGEVRCVVVAMEASLIRNADGTPNGKDPSYPFIAPVARLKSGKEIFSPGSTIEEGSRISMDLDWTPSLHLADAIMNVGLKVKESIMQGEPVHPEPEPEIDPFDEVAKGVDEVAKGARRFASNFGQRAAKFGKSLTPKAGTSQSHTTPQLSSAGSGSGKHKKKSPREQHTPGEVRIGQEINLLEEPWVNAHGVYSCKAIRRPPFIEEILSKSTKEAEQMSSPTAMFRSLAQSARSVMEESFLMLTETHLIELKASKLNMSVGKVVFCIPIEMMAKLKFRRQESLSLFFKSAPDDPLVYMCPDSSDAVKQIQGVLKKKGVRGKHTNAAAYRAISEAMQIVQDIQTKEMAIEHEPTVERVNEIMDLYRQAAERFEIAGDVRHEEVVTHMRKFLAKPTTVSILDGSYRKAADVIPKSKSADGQQPEGEVLEPTAALMDYDDEEGEADAKPALTAASPASADKEFEDNIENLLQDAKQDFENFDVSDDDIDVKGSGAAGDGLDDIDNMAADLDAMMAEADKELQDLMSS